MVKKFNLSVPDDLARRIQEKRHYLGSLSAIFQEAVSDKIQKREDFEQRLKGEEDMETTIERLRKEKRKAETDYLQKGREDGLVWAKAASYTDLEYARKFDPTDEDGCYDPTVPLHDDVLGHYFIDMLEADPLANPEDDEDELNEFAQQWLNGWIEAVSGFWNEIVAKV